ncbi:fibronectin type III domain-containing protein [Micromonospora sp. CPCC 205556]|uniref:fibronectin type III domain-containing protein n=1 Tax=Micromonospora sp. CPCC 205556 TaxID=3122398 RepID=UPI002FEE6D02
MTAPPWSSAAPPQPLTTAPDETGRAKEHTAPAPTDADGSTDLVDGSVVAYDVPERRADGGDPSTPVPPGPGPAEDGTYPAVSPVFAPPPPPAYPVPAEPERRGRGRTVAAVVAGVALVATAGVVGAVVLDREAPAPGTTSESAATPGAPKATGAPPGDLKLRDDGTAITISWSDPTGGAVPFMVAGGRAGRSLGVMATVDPGQTSHTVNGLNASVDYCFTVLAVYSTDAFATSGQVCTDRERPSPSS